MDCHLRVNRRCHPPRKVRARRRIHWHHHRSRQHATKERRHPLRAVLTPQHHVLAPPDAAARQHRCKTSCCARHPRVRPPLHPVPAPVRYRRFSSAAPVLLDKFNQGLPCHSVGQFLLSRPLFIGPEPI